MNNHHILTLLIGVFAAVTNSSEGFTFPDPNTGASIYNKYTLRSNNISRYLHHINTSTNKNTKQQYPPTKLFSQNAKANEPEKATNGNDRTTTSTTSKDVMSEAQSLKLQAQRARLEADKLEATLTLEKLSLLEKQLRSVILNDEKRDEIQIQIEQLAKKIDPSFVPRFSTSSTTTTKTSSSSTSTSTTSTQSPNTTLDAKEKSQDLSPDLTPTELYEAYVAFSNLPLQVQITLAKAVDIDIRKEVISSKVSNDVVQKINQQQKILLNNPKKLQDIYKEIMDSSTNSIKAPASPSMSMQEGKDGTTTTTISEETMEDLQSILTDITSGGSQTKRFVESSYPASTRKDGAAPTKEDVDYFFHEILDAKNVFNPTSKPEAVPGGYLIRGNSMLKEEANLVEAIDQAFERSELAEKYNFFYVQDPTPEALEDMEDFFGKPVILLMGRDMSPTTNKFVLSVSSLFSLSLMFLFSLRVFGSNELIVNRLQEANAVGDYNVEWFNELITPLLFSIFAIQAGHELAHFVISKRDNFKISAPTFLPALALPTFGSNTSIKTSPPTTTSLFDFGISGPVVGILLSTIFFLTGLQMTTSVTDAAIYSYFPALPIDLLKFSRLGGSVVDASLGGVLTSSLTSDISTIQLHPFAIAGYTGLVVNALNLLPLGNTDGGRISQAIFGRNGHSVIQGFIYLGIFGSSLFGYDETNILLAYALLCLFAQGDFEIPSRDEIKPLPLPRVFIALGMWVFVGLTLFPL